ncbi:hypothetical protein ABB37_03341 [Leptomonas pyrrhocoris]|uniref:Ribosomal RNA large subunit methyltransferase K/L-like methyltransferase domain-containing protein n=1 Tax=Leptomonas pyrrhocoris TaxID=157538 RepID=A0A0M9G4Q4_LEPPY|nr:hypothetical protein ABB37_03341 [Leptomonas pyrrhocoris]KPA82223.1 hypothetical protein ABB37_03341 [Leptomonas pyrrhocoris]|eukprot:XP_015660662.1 hypothetical protein ABB37_03341 [Leptomonas pyrrhocoris]
MAGGATLDDDVYSRVYAAFFPSGIEDVVLAAVTRLAIQYHLKVESCQYDDAGVPPESSVVGTAPDPAEIARTATPRGLLLFTLRQAKTADDENVSDKCFCEARADAAAQLCGFLAAACTLRVIERLGLHLWTIPITGHSNDATLAAMHRTIETKAAYTNHCVVQVMSNVRESWGALRRTGSSLLPRAALLWGPQFFQPLTNADVAFRVNCERRVMDDCPGSLKSVELAAAAGDSLWELHNPPHHWEVSMLYYNVEFFILQDNDHWLTCAVTLSPPAPPRCGYDIDVTFQYAAELLRQRIGVALRRGEVTLDQVKGLVPRASADRQEIRWSKGACAMRSTVASALCVYAGLEDAANFSACPVLLLDPFCGSGTTLLEGWMHLLQRTPGGDTHRGGVVMGSELVASDVQRTLLNTREDYLAWVAALYGHFPVQQAGQAEEKPQWWAVMEEKVNVWRAAVEDRVAEVACRGSYLTCGADGLRELLSCAISSPIDADRMTRPSAILCERTVPRGGSAFAVLRCDATRVPVRAGSVECVVSDMPFGRRCGSHKGNVRLYPPFLRECHRLLRSPSPQPPTAVVHDAHTCATVEWWRCSSGGKCTAPVRSVGGRAVLLTVEHRLMVETLEQLRDECPFHLVTSPFQVDLGGLFPFVFVLDKL